MKTTKFKQEILSLVERRQVSKSTALRWSNELRKATWARGYGLAQSYCVHLVGSRCQNEKAATAGMKEIEATWKSG